MKMDLVADSRDDEFYTPLYAVLPVLKYLPSPSISTTIWCPFDTPESMYVKEFIARGYRVIWSHISDGGDFFKIDPDVINADYIISNPPYSCKGEVLDRLFQIGTPFAMLVGVVGLFESQERFNMFKQNEFEIMYFNKRVSYFKDFAQTQGMYSPPFSSVYVCHKMLPKQIVFEEIDISNTVRVHKLFSITD